MKLHDWIMELHKSWCPTLRAEYTINAKLAYHYAVLRDLGDRLKVKSLCEFGIGYGYGALSLTYHSENANILGIDSMEDHESGRAMKNAYRILSRRGHRVTLLNAFTSQLKCLCGRFDLAYLDASQTKHGLTHEMELALPVADRLLIQVRNHVMKETAIPQFCDRHGLQIEHIDDRFHGVALLERCNNG